MQKVVVDTNALIDNPYLLEENYEFYIPFVVLEELDNLKYNDNIGQNVRIAIKLINDRKDKNVTIEKPKEFESKINDDKIIQVAKEINGALATNDINMIVKASSLSIPTISNLEKVYDKNYYGYFKVKMNDDYYYKTFSSLHEFMLPEIDEYLIEKPKEIPENSYLIVTPESESQNWQIVRKVGGKYVKIDTSKKMLRGLKLKGQIDLDEEVAIALNAIFSDTLLTILDGELGSGKTLTATLGALLQVAGQKNKKKYDKIYITRAPVAIERSLELGFDKGTINNKLQQWVTGFKHALAYLFGDEEGENIYNEFIEPISLESIQGSSFHKSIVIVDEAQHLSNNVMKQVLGRVADTSKLLLLLDPKQNYGVNRGREGYMKLLANIKDEPMISYVKMTKIRRSPLSEFAIRVFD